jgi:hypothetical protein
MDQRSIVLYLARKDLPAMEIDNDLAATLRSDAMGHNSVMYFLGEAKFPSPNPSTTFSEENPCLDDSSEAVLLALTERRFASYQDSHIYHHRRSTGG